AENADGTWNHLRIEIRGSSCRVSVGDHVAYDKHLQFKPPPRGGIALAAYAGGLAQCTVYYDNVVVTPLAAAKPGPCPGSGLALGRELVEHRLGHRRGGKREDRARRTEQHSAADDADVDDERVELDLLAEQSRVDERVHQVVDHHVGGDPRDGVA